MLGHVADFIEKQRAAIGLLDFANRAFLARAGEGTVFVAKQFGLDQGFGNGRAIDRHKRLASPVGIAMNGLRHQVLARAGFTQKHDRNVTPAHHAQLADHRRHLRIAGVKIAQRGQLLPARRSGLAGRLALHRSGRRPHVVAPEPLHSLLDFDPAGNRHAVVQTQRMQTRKPTPAEFVKMRHGNAEQRRKSVCLERVVRQPQLELGTAVGRQEAPIGGKHHDAFNQGADEFRPAVKMNAHGLGEGVGEHVVFDHLRRHAHQGHGVLVHAAVVAAHVQRPDQLAVGVHDGRARAGQELVGVHVMLAAVNHDGLLLAQRGANRIRALAVFGPVHTGCQRHLRRLFQKVVVTQRMQHHALGRGQ